MNILGIESTCDETACAIVQDGKKILSNIVLSQHEIHQNWGGVIPELACRRHIEALLPVICKATEEANISLEEIAAVAVAHGPGLIGALLIGLHGAKALSLALDKPLIGINHIEAHLYAALMGEEMVQFPALGVVLSGGHTTIVKMEGIRKYQLIAQTVDDAIGEAFDKVARILNLPYPGGPHVEKLAHSGDPSKYPFKPGFVKEKPFDFSFSGLKTATLYAARGQNGTMKEVKALDQQHAADIAASFQYVAFSDIIKKTELAAQIHGCKTIVFGGGVTNNKTLRERFKQEIKNLLLIWPPHNLSLDNGAMIAGLAYHKLREGRIDNYFLEATCSLSF
jgi:N6-L-threonylcarbamoyladenine synthase